MTFHSDDGKERRMEQPEEVMPRTKEDSESSDSQLGPSVLNTSTETGLKRRRYY
jgi:hypothetical protein